MDDTLVEHLQTMTAEHMLGVYFALLVAPFVQEDAAVIAAASLSLGGMGQPALLFVVALLGLTASDLWKYWIGRAARTHAWARRLAAKPALARAERLVHERLGVALMTARFIPGTRIPLYVAAGYFKADWWRFAFWIAVSAATYIAAAFVLFHTVGAVAGEHAKRWLPAIAVGALATFLVARWLMARRRARAP